MRSSCDCVTCAIKYFVNGILCTPADTNGIMLFHLTDKGRSKKDPCFKNLVEKPAKGPNNKAVLPSIKRVSKCGTDIGGEPTLAFPYTFASCLAITSGLLQTNH